MKKILLLCCLSALTLNPVWSQWVNVKPAGLHYIRDISVLDDNKAFLLSSDSVSLVYKTVDGGAHWTSFASPQLDTGDYSNLEGIQFLDEQNGFIYGGQQVNGGVFGGGTEKFVLFSTTDGGQSWKALLPDVPALGFLNISSIHFFNALQGVTTLTTGLSYELVQTTDDGGLTWQTRDTLHDWPNDMHFNADGSGFVLRYEHDFHAHVSSYKLYQVEDFGKSWTAIGDPLADPAWVEHRKGLWFDQMLHLDNNRAFRIRTDLQGPGNSDNILFVDRSVDGGNSWQDDLLTLTGEYLNRLELSGNAVWVQTWENLYRINLSTLSTQGAVNEELSLQLAPNPASKGATIRLETSAALHGQGTLRLYNPAGQLLTEAQLQFQEGVAQLQLGDLQAGMYLVAVDFQGKRVLKKLELW